MRITNTCQFCKLAVCNIKYIGDNEYTCVATNKKHSCDHKCDVPNCENKYCIICNYCGFKRIDGIYKRYCKITHRDKINDNSICDVTDEEYHKFVDNVMNMKLSIINGELKNE